MQVIKKEMAFVSMTARVHAARTAHLGSYIIRRSSGMDGLALLPSRAKALIAVPAWE